MSRIPFSRRKDGQNQEKSEGHSQPAPVNRQKCVFIESALFTMTASQPAVVTKSTSMCITAISLTTSKVSYHCMHDKDQGHCQY